MLEVVGGILKSYHDQHGISVDKLGQPPVRTRLLHPFLEERGVVDKINIREVHIETSRIVAKVQKFKGEAGPYSGILDYANIYYAANHNLCWRRFGVCKEMYHCMIDRTEADRVATVDSLKYLLELLASDTTAITGEFPPLNREQEAELMALETLFPVEFRMVYLESPIEDQAEYARLAEQFKIPAEYAYMACQPNYLKLVVRLRGRLLDLK